MANDERIAVVDKSGKILKYKMRSELTDADCKRAACVWVENDQGQVLLQQRALSVQVDPGLWSVAVLGTVVDDDTYEETAARETKEEIGLSGFALAKKNRVYYKASFGWRLAQGYVITCNWALEKFTIQPEEVAKIEWVDKNQLLKEITGNSPLSRPYINTYSVWPELFNLV